jgi:hypothetical protein
VPPSAPSSARIGIVVAALAGLQPPAPGVEAGGLQVVDRAAAVHGLALVPGPVRRRVGRGPPPAPPHEGEGAHGRVDRPHAEADAPERQAGGGEPLADGGEEAAGVVARGGLAQDELDGGRRPVAAGPGADGSRGPPGSGRKVLDRLGLASHARLRGSHVPPA